MVDKGSEFYNRSIKSWLEKNDVEMYSTHNEGKSVIAERFIRTLKNKIYKYMTSVSKNVYIDKLDDIVTLSSPPPFCGGGPEKFSMLPKRGGLALFEFLGEGREFFQGGPEDFLKVIFNC